MIRNHSNGITLAIRAQLGAKKTAITGIYGEGEQTAVRIAVHAPPIEGRANEALIEFLADIFRLPKSAIELLSGRSSRNKLFLLKGATVADAKAAIQAATPQANYFWGTE